MRHRLLRPRRRRPWSRPETTVLHTAAVGQFDATQEPMLSEEPDEPVLHLVVSAAGAKPPRTRAPRSVFELDASMLTPSALLPGRGQRGARADTGTALRVIECRRDDSTTRCTGGQYPADRWTPEKAEQEVRRRAKQRPPKPTQRFKRKGKKLLSLIGDDVWDA